jgi:hypothetical protein
VPVRSIRRHAWVLAGYVLAAVALTWPLVLHLDTHLTGPPGGDTGVYVWNQWVFRHELLNRQFPYFTDTILAPLGGSANLSLHNYTTFQDLLALPLIGWLGVVATFNIVYLLMIVFTAYATFLLARHVTNQWAEAWLAGLVFAWSPILVTRGTGHFSLVAAAPLALFLLVLLRADGHERLRDAVALGGAMWLAASTDVYYAVYCVVIGAVFLVSRVLAIERSPFSGRHVAIRWTLDALLLLVAGLIAAMAFSGGWEVTVAGRALSMRSLYTPMLVLTLLVVARFAWEWRMRRVNLEPAGAWRLATFVAASAAVAVTLLSPVLFAAALRVSGGDGDASPILWRSSPSGVDLLAFIVPNPNHPFASAQIDAWLTARPRGFVENVASMSIVSLLTMAVAWCLGWRPSRWWAGLSILFALMALGPFVQVAGVNTHLPGPWAVLRYVPVVGLARTPARFAVVVALGVAILFAAALVFLGRRYPARRPLLLCGAGALIVFELLPVPIPLYSAAVPSVYAHVAAAPDDVRLLELPWGLRDGTTSVGDFTARSQFFQTVHGKYLVGGYLSRVAWDRRLPEVRGHPVLDALVTLSEGQPLAADRVEKAVHAAPDFLRATKIGYVMVDRSRAAGDLQAFARRAFDLELVAADGALELYRPRTRP